MLIFWTWPKCSSIGPWLHLLIIISWTLYMCCVVAGSVGNRQHWLVVRYSQKKKSISIVFCCSENLMLITLGPTGLIQVGFKKMYLSKWALQSSRTLKMSHVRVLTDFPRSHHLMLIMNLDNGKGILENCVSNHYFESRVMVAWTMYIEYKTWRLPVYTLLTLKYRVNCLNAPFTSVLRQNMCTILTATGSF